MNICVVGAGIAGITSAYYLTKSGHAVTIFDSESGPAEQCSYANAGQISVSNSEVWTTWRNVVKGLQWLAKKDAPLLIRPSLDLDKAKWLLKFLYYTATNSYERNTIYTIKLGLESRQLYDEIVLEEQIQFDQLRAGILHLYRDQDWFKSALKTQELYEWNGCDFTVLANSKEYKFFNRNIGKFEDLKETNPAVAEIQGVTGAAVCHTDWTGDIHKFCNQLFNKLVSKYGVSYEFNKLIKNVDDLYDYDCIVLANGAGVRHLSKLVGDCHPVYPVKGYSITIPLDSVGMANSPNISVLDQDKKIVCTKLGDRLRIAGTAEITGDDYEIREDRIKPLVDWVNNNLPKVNTERYDSWACLRPMTPNMLPIISQSKFNKKVFYHTGHGHLGWTLSAATAKKLTNIINQ